MAVHPRFFERFDLLAGLPADVVETLAGQMTLASFSRREVVLGAESPGALGFLLEGRLQAVDFTLDGREVGLYFTSPGDFFGELTVVGQVSARELIIALCKSNVMFLPKEAARHLLFATPLLAERIVDRLSTRVQDGLSQRVLLAFPNPVQRLYALLLQLATGSQRRIVAAPTHQELAIMINTSRETVTRAFQHLQSGGVLRRDGSDFLIDQTEVLQAALDGGEGGKAAG